MIELLGKQIDPENMEILREVSFTEEFLKNECTVKGGEWTVEDGWLTGLNRENCPGILLLNEEFKGPIMMDFYARTIPPCDSDIDCLWNISWDDAKGDLGMAYECCFPGWYEGKIGFEKMPDAAFNVLLPMHGFESGRTYHMQAGSIAGHIFLILDGELVFEITDPNPVDDETHPFIGFEAYCSHIQYRDLKVRRATYVPTQKEYTAQF